MRIATTARRRVRTLLSELPNEFPGPIYMQNARGRKSPGRFPCGRITTPASERVGPASVEHRAALLPRGLRRLS